MKILKVKSKELVENSVSIYLNGYYLIKPINQMATVMYLNDNYTGNDWSLLEGEIYVTDKVAVEVFNEK